MVSNHGARNLDTVPATIEALPLVAEKVAGRVPVIVDGGVRRGTDVLKALANGANAAMIGRPYLYGLSVAGDAGVTRVCGHFAPRIRNGDGPYRPADHRQHRPQRALDLIASATTRISRKDFGLLWNRAIEGAAVGDDVDIELDVELVQRSVH